ncbi:hypothetical protein Micbo1qcDRAFT_8627 [Microdochium bolleyi]|uniref:Uncharacterized protein n=1 Tax=Microdochium bolleyi TaxID=196109 RepID=A0A136JK79_9PEZI|nr:hypothetical protein Micbo1qcDRAFT_8627 [Microdochium bolleyi]
MSPAADSCPVAASSYSGGRLDMTKEAHMIAQASDNDERSPCPHFFRLYFGEVKSQEGTAWFLTVEMMLACLNPFSKRRGTSSSGPPCADDAVRRWTRTLVEAVLLLMGCTGGGENRADGVCFVRKVVAWTLTLPLAVHNGSAAERSQTSTMLLTPGHPPLSRETSA